MRISAPEDRGSGGWCDLCAESVRADVGPPAHRHDHLVTDQQHEGAAARFQRKQRERILFVFYPWRSAILLVAGDKAGQWNRWYDQAIPRAVHLYEIYLKERAQEESRP